MGNKWMMHTSTADKRAIELHLQLRKIEEMPKIQMDFPDDRKTITLWEKGSPRGHYQQWNVNTILRLDVDKAMQDGGTLASLLNSVRRPNPQVSQTEVDAGVDRFLSGQDE